jgi:hypothetical protein
MLASILSTFPTYHSVAEAAEQQHTGRTLTDGIEVSYEYLNFTAQEIVISLRCGLKLRIPAIYDMRNLTNDRRFRFVIRATYKVYMGTQDELHRCTTEATDESSQTVLIMREHVKLQERIHRNTNFISIIDYPVYLEDLKKNGGCVYSADGDVMVSVAGFENTPFHPFSKESNNIESIKQHIDIDKKHEIQFMVKIIDNHCATSAKFYNIGNNVYKVVPYCDNTQEEGIYFIGSSPVKSVKQNESKVIERHPLTAALSLGLFSTIEDAMCFGDPALQRKGALAEYEHKNLISKKELEASKMEFEKEKLEMEKEKRLWEAAIDRDRLFREVADREREQRRLEEELEMKSRYEKQSYSRKNTSEIIKFIPAILAAATAVAVVVRKTVLKA